MGLAPRIIGFHALSSYFRPYFDVLRFRLTPLLNVILYFFCVSPSGDVDASKVDYGEKQIFTSVIHFVSNELRHIKIRTQEHHCRWSKTSFGSRWAKLQDSKWLVSRGPIFLLFGEHLLHWDLQFFNAIDIQASSLPSLLASILLHRISALSCEANVRLDQSFLSSNAAYVTVLRHGGSWPQADDQVF